MTRTRLALLLLLVAACNQKNTPDTGSGSPNNTGPGPNAGTGQQPAEAGQSLADARKGFTTKLVAKQKANEPVDQPPPKAPFRTVQYDSPAGKLAAYLTPDPKNGKKNPAIVWITGGDCNSIGDSAWTPAKPSNDQSARQYREAGIVMMFPSLRGGNQNPGFREGFFGEVDDVVAAADFLARQDYVDPKRIYLGGHSTGGTLVLLAAEYTGRFRATFSFGPVQNPAGYGEEYGPPVDPSDKRELALRAPINWLGSVRTPTFVIEGATEGNAFDLVAMKNKSQNPNLHFFLVKGADHFSVLAPTNRLIAQKILKDDGPECNITITEAELGRPPGT